MSEIIKSNYYEKIGNKFYYEEEYVKEKDKEIERLNNIINELEDYICVIEYDERHSDSWQIPVRIHNKLKELKGGNKE